MYNAKVQIRTHLLAAQAELMYKEWHPHSALKMYAGEQVSLN